MMQHKVGACSRPVETGASAKEGRVNVTLYASDWDVERQRDGVPERLIHLGRRLAGELLGATMFEVEPRWQSYYHLHHGNEELLLVVEGAPSVRTTEGERELRPGDLVLFRRGAEGAHQIANRSDRPARFVVFSSMVQPDVVELPEADAVGAMAGGVPTAGRDTPLELWFRRDAAIGYFEVGRAEST
jgi:uncharacterized cupin superfamily protein